MRFLDCLHCARRPPSPPSEASAGNQRLRRRSSSVVAGDLWLPSLEAIAENDMVLQPPADSTSPAKKAGKRSPKRIAPKNTGKVVPPAAAAATAAAAAAAARLWAVPVAFPAVQPVFII
ncbi:hypothetical protein AXF42_Ash020269 [Apostasia shenzhenica]|uniref:Uncharacterized protein n=1 Tax=Apostasia shenzhenica TaxID=1088818 RepID=A0A2H9ZSX3_9ASPA|nr:hypothetical protein AXF42_Ash020269 [Apostasia shenzhenica]